MANGFCYFPNKVRIGRGLSSRCFGGGQNGGKLSDVHCWYVFDRSRDYGNSVMLNAQHIRDGHAKVGIHSPCCG